MSIELFAKKIDASIEISSQTQDFTFDNSTSQFQIINLFTPIDAVYSYNALEFKNANASGYRIVQKTLDSGVTGSLIIESFITSALPGTPLFTFNENGRISVNTSIDFEFDANFQLPASPANPITLSYFTNFDIALTGVVEGTAILGDGAINTVFNPVIDIQSANFSGAVSFLNTATISVDCELHVLNTGLLTIDSDANFNGPVIFSGPVSWAVNSSNYSTLMSNINSSGITEFNIGAVIPYLKFGLNNSSSEAYIDSLFQSFYIKMAGTTMATFAQTGNVGFGTTVPTTAKLVINGGVFNVASETTCLRAIGSNNSTKIELQNTSGSGRLYELRSDSDGTFGIFDRTGGFTNFKLTSGTRITGYNLLNSQAPIVGTPSSIQLNYINSATGGYRFIHTLSTTDPFVGVGLGQFKLQAFNSAGVTLDFFHADLDSGGAGALFHIDAPTAFTNNLQVNGAFTNVLSSAVYDFVVYNSHPTGLSRYVINPGGVPAVAFAYDASGHESYIDALGFPFSLRNNGSTQLYKTATGNFGFGTTTPNAVIQLASVISNRKIVLFEIGNNDHQVYSMGVNTSLYRFQVPTTSDRFAFFCGTSSSASTELARITAGGNGSTGTIGVNTTTIAAGFHITGGVRNVTSEDTGIRVETTNSNTAKIELKNSNTNGRLYELQSNNNAGSGTAFFEITDRTASASRFRIDASGYCSLGGATTSGIKLDVIGVLRATRLLGSANTPTIAAGAGAGTGATVSISGSELSGSFSITAGTSPTGTLLATLTLSSAMLASTYGVNISPAGTNAAGLATATWSTTISTTQVEIHNATPLTATTVYTWNYHIIG